MNPEDYEEYTDPFDYDYYGGHDLGGSGEPEHFNFPDDEEADAEWMMDQILSESTSGINQFGAAMSTIFVQEYLETVESYDVDTSKPTKIHNERTSEYSIEISIVGGPFCDIRVFSSIPLNQFDVFEYPLKSPETKNVFIYERTSQPAYEELFDRIVFKFDRKV